GHLPLSSNVTGSTNFLRYLRSVSPSTHVFLFLLFLALLIGAIKNEPAEWTLRRAVSILGAGLALGLLTGAPMYYWTTAYTGVALLAAISAGRTRLMALLVLIIG